MGEHTVSSFDEELGEIDRLIRDMGDLSGAMTRASTNALLHSDTALAQRVISDDTIMDAKQRDLDERAITLIAKRDTTLRIANPWAGEVQVTDQTGHVQVLNNQVLRLELKQDDCLKLTCVSK